MIFYDSGGLAQALYGGILGVDCSAKSGEESCLRNVKRCTFAGALWEAVYLAAAFWLTRALKRKDYTRSLSLVRCIIFMLFQEVGSVGWRRVQSRSRVSRVGGFEADRCSVNGFKLLES